MNDVPVVLSPLDAEDNRDGSITAKGLFTLFEQADNIDYKRWNQVYPYQLLLVKRNSDGKWTTQDQKGICKNWKYTLPFTPESLQKGMTFAINVMATQSGVIEEHNGAPFRNISFSGTTGVMPLKGSADIKGGASIGEAVFAGTITNFSRAAQAGQLITGPKVNDDIRLSDSEIDDIYKSSGYYQIRLLSNFLENYVTFKKTARARDYQLAFAIWKDEEVFLVTPSQFTVSRNASSPFEYMYNLSFRAWARVKLDVQAISYGTYQPATREPNQLAKVINALQQARETLAGIKSTISAVPGDLDHALYEPLREAALFVKDALGMPTTFADLPAQILQTAKKSLITFIATKESAEAVSSQFNEKKANIASAWNSIVKLGVKLGVVETGGGNVSSFNEALTTDPANNIFDNPVPYFALFDKIQIGQVKLPPSVIAQIAQEKRRVRQLTRLDFEQRRDTLKKLIADFSDAVGAGDTTYNATFSRNNQISTKTPTAIDFQAMYALNTALMELNRLAVSQKTNAFQLSAEQFVAGLAAQNNISFTIPQSKFSVPFPYGSTLEELAETYLGSRDRWIEIATLNGLRAPYVDEEGFDLPLLTTGNGNDVVVASDENLYVGQMVWLSSTNTKRTIRHIQGIRELGSGQIILNLDGDPDLARFTVASQATLHAFLPYTVNSMQTVYIPSSLPSSIPELDTKTIPGVNQYDRLFAVGGVDLLLTPDNNLVITEDGDGRLAVGLTAIIQDARIKVSVPQGSLPRHPQFGLGVPIGSSVADIDAKTLLKAANDTFSADPTYTGVRTASIKKQGPAVVINLQVGVAGVAQDIPLSFNIKR